MTDLPEGLDATDVGDVIREALDHTVAAMKLATDELLPMAVFQRLRNAATELAEAELACPDRHELERAQFLRDDARGHGPDFQSG